MKKYSLLVACLFISCISYSQIATVDFIIKNVNIVDVVNNKIIPNQAVVVETDFIKATGNSQAIQKRYKALMTIDGQANLSCLPYGTCMCILVGIP